MNLDAALETFLAEARELLSAMEDALLKVEQDEADAELVNAVFRAAHTIKGSAGLFGLDAIVSFTHVLENVLDRVRDASLAMDGELVQLCLRCGDHLALLIDNVAAGSPDADPEANARGAGLQAQLTALLGGGSPGHTKDSGPSVYAGASQPAEAGVWHISLRFGHDVLRNGMDPLSFITYLRKLGELVSVQTVTDALPAANEMDPESCYLGFEVGLKSNATHEQIEQVFEFVRDDATIHIVAPGSKAERYLELIRNLPEEDMRIGEMLVRCGSVTREQLARALEQQALELQSAAAPIGEILTRQGAVEHDVVEAGLARQKQTRERKSLENQSVRVDAQKLDQLIDMVGELVIAGSAVGLIGQNAGLAELSESIATLSRLVEGVRDRALQLRMVQIGATFNRFKRVVHDVSRELGKDIALEIDGEDTELDKTVVEQIADPLTHLVRNSMDHGIETAEVRRARGKPERGTVRLNAYHDSGSIVIEISDDGGGLKRDRILAKAIERGLVPVNASLSDNEVCNLIFEPGFSTAEAITNLSGRGVGLDVVKRNVTALRGTVNVMSTEGVGATMRICLPLTLAIIDGFLVRLADSTFVVPLDVVDECIELERSDSIDRGMRSYVNLRGEALPFVKLREVFVTQSTAPTRENVVVIKHGSKRVGLVVDGLLGQAQAVIKPLGGMFKTLRGISGSTILGNGKVALILDVPGLVELAASREHFQDAA